MDLPKHYTLVSSDKDSFELHDSRDDVKFKIARRPLHPARQIRVLELPKFAEGGTVRPGLDFEIEKLKGRHEPQVEMYQAPLMDQASAQGMQSPYDPAVFGLPEQPVMPSPEEMGGQSEQPAAPMPGANMPSMGGMPDVAGILNEGSRAQMNIAKAESDQQQQIAKAYEPFIKAQEEQMATFQQKMQDYQQQADMLAQGVASGNVDPKKYMGNMDAGAKVATAIGVLLAGIGQGLTGGNSNPAMDYINKQIDRDIEAQKANLGKKQNLLSQNLQIQGNLLQAEQATRIQMASIFQGQIAKLAAQSNSPILMEKAKLANAEWRAKLAPVQAELAQASAKQAMAKRAMMSGDALNAAVAMVPEKFMGEALKEAGTIKQTKNALAQVDGIMKDLAELNSLNYRAKNPIQFQERLKTAKIQLFPLVKQIVGEKMSEGDVQNMVNPMIGSLWENVETANLKKKNFKNLLIRQAAGAAPTLSQFSGFDALKFLGASDRKFTEGPVK